MRDWDMANNHLIHEVKASDSKFAVMLYKPTLSAIKSCMSMTIAELCITLFIVSIFVNSAILIVAAASLSEAASDADLPGMYRLFVQTIGQGAGTMFALALLFSGISAGIVATMAGQYVLFLSILFQLIHCAFGSFNCALSLQLIQHLSLPSPSKRFKYISANNPSD
jgi:metal iron transporter